MESIQTEDKDVKYVYLSLIESRHFGNRHFGSRHFGTVDVSGIDILGVDIWE